MFHSILHSFKIKGSIFAIILVLLFQTNNPVIAITYHFQDDFEDGSSGTWLFHGEDYTISPGFTTNTFEEVNGTLVSGGSYNENKYNVASLPDNTTQGVWGFDVVIPEDAPQGVYFPRLMAIHFSDRRVGPITNETWSFYTSFSLMIRTDELTFFVNNETSTFIIEEHQNLQSTLIRGIHHYDLVRTSSTFYLFIDGNEIYSTSVSSNYGPKLSYFAFDTAQGSSIAFDNVSISTDATGFLDNLLETSKGLTSSTGISSTSSVIVTSPSDDSSKNEAIFFTIGASSIAIMAAFFQNWRIKKNHYQS